MELQEILISEEFDDQHGQFKNYDTYDIEQRSQIRSQKHIDIRNFNPTNREILLLMIHLDRLTMNDMKALDMEELEGTAQLETGESWTIGTLEKQIDKNYVWGLTLNCPSGVIETTS